MAKKKLSGWWLEKEINDGEHSAFKQISGIDDDTEYEIEDLWDLLVTQWKNLDVNFTKDLTKAWIDRGFSYSEIQEYLNAGNGIIGATDYELIRFIRSVKGWNGAEMLNNYPTDDTSLKTEFNSWLLTNPFAVKSPPTGTVPPTSHPTTPPTPPIPTPPTPTTPAPSTPTPAPSVDNPQARKLYEGLARIFNEWIGIKPDEASKEQKEEEKWKKEWEDLSKGIPVFDKKNGTYQSKVPFWYNEEYEENWATNSDGTPALDSEGQPYKKRKPNTGVFVDSFEKYKQYRQDQKTWHDSQFGNPPYKGEGGREIWTYEQWKQVALWSNPNDYLSNNKLTFLASFIEPFFKQESSGTVRKHLIELFLWIQYDLQTKQPAFWNKIKGYVEQQTPIIPPAPDLPKDIKEWLQRVRDYINFVYFPYNPKETLLNPSKYYGEIEAIVADLEIQLTEVWRKYLQNPNNFTIRNNKLLTTITSTKEYGENTNLTNTVARDKLLQRTNESDGAEIPLKTSQADNLKNWDRYKAMLFKNQSRDTFNEHTKYDNTRNTGQGGKRGQAQDVKSIFREVDPRVDAKLMEIIMKMVDKFVIYGGIQARLDKYFFTLGEPLYHYIDDNE